MRAISASFLWLAGMVSLIVALVGYFFAPGLPRNLHLRDVVAYLALGCLCLYLSWRLSPASKGERLWSYKYLFTGQGLICVVIIAIMVITKVFDALVRALSG